MKTSEITVGLTKDYWTVIGGPTRRNRTTFYTCQCICGTVRDIAAGSLGGDSKSCGCLRSKLTSARKTTHGQNRKGKRSRLYGIWAGMHQRCTNPKTNRYSLYGGRGISVCDEWKPFEVFAAWAATSGYANDLQIDRIDCNKGYTPENCRWVTSAIQNRNKRNVKIVTAFGEAKTLAEWASDPRCSVHRITIRHRMLKLKWPPERAITEPPRSTALHPK